MTSEPSAAFGSLSTPLIADACLRLRSEMMLAPAGIEPIHPGDTLAGRVLPVRHYGSVDVFLESFESAEGGEVLVIDNGGRTDEGCIGDLTVLEAQAAGLGGILVWGAHRDSAELKEIDFPVFSYGTCPAGPRRLDPRDPNALSSAFVGDAEVDANHVLFADDDGAIFVPLADVGSLLTTAAAIFETERRQADLVRDGTTLRDQLQFGEYLKKASADPSHSFRDHLREIGGAIEE